MRQVWWPMVWPSAAIRRTSAGCSDAGLPIRKNVARTHSCASAASTRDVVAGPRAVVEGQHDLAIRKRQGLRKALQAHPRRGGGIDGENARSPERSGARTVRRLRRRGPRDRGDNGSSKQPDRFRGSLVSGRICHCARCCRLGNASSDNSDKFINPVKRRGAVWPKILTLPRPPMRRCSTVTRCGTRMARFVTSLSRKSRARFKPADAAFLRAIVAELHEADLGDLIEALEPDDRVSLVELTGADFDFSALNEVDNSVREEILEELEPETVAEGVRELESDDAVELLEGLDEEDQEEILEKLPPSERDALERSLDYPENSAGRRMQTEFIAVPPDWTVGQAIDYMRDTPDLPDRFYEIYAVDARKHWQGAVSLDALLRARRPVPLADLIDEEPPPRLGAGRPGGSGAAVRQVQSGGGSRRRYREPAGRRHHHRRRGRRDRGGGRRGPEGAGRRHLGRRIVRQCLDHRQGPLQLAAGQSRHRLSRLLGARPVRRPARKDGGAGGAGADRRQPGRQCRDPDHDGGGARAGDPRTRPQQRLSRGRCARAWSASSTGSPLR